VPKVFSLALFLSLQQMEEEAARGSWLLRGSEGQLAAAKRL